MAKDQQNDFRESVQRQIDKGKAHYEGNRADAEKKIQRILELIKSESQRKKRGSKNSRRDSELIGLIEDFHKEHQSLYELCDRLQEQGKSVYGSEAQSSWSFSSLDSEYFSSEEVGSSPGKKELNNVDELKNNSRQDLDNANVERDRDRDREVTILKKKLVSIRQEREALDFEYKKALSKIEELENTLNELTTEADGRIKELSTLRQEHRALGTKSSARTKELEAQLTSLKVELDSLCKQKRNLEGYLKSQATEIRQLKEKNKGLQSHVLELELISKDRANQISSLMKKIKDVEKETSSTASELNAQVRSLQFELKTTYAQKCELEQRAEQLVDKDKDYSYQLEVLRNELNDSASQLESKNKEISKYCKQLESLKEELQLKNGEAQRGMDVNKKLTMKVNDLKLELEALTEHENELEEQLRNGVQETLLLRNEKEGLDAKVVELERSLAEMGNEVSALQDKLKAEKDAYTKSNSMLKTRVVNLQEEVEALNAQRRKLELRSEIERRESPRKAIYVENKGFQLTSKTSLDQAALSSDQEDSSVGSRSSRRHRITKNLSPDLDLQLVERKMEEYTEEYRMKIEDNIRILGQRILLIEHLHLETKESYKLNKECFHQGSKMLKECTMAHKSDLMKLKDASIMANDALIWLDLVIRTFEDRSNKIITRVSSAMKELQFIKAQLSNCNSEDEMSCQSQKIDNNQELEVLKESTQELSARLEGEVKERLRLVKVADELEKKVQELEKLIRERDQGILSVGEEKREAIRQLCFLVDYHRDRCDQYREVILKITGRRSRTN